MQSKNMNKRLGRDDVLKINIQNICGCFGLTVQQVVADDLMFGNFIDWLKISGFFVDNLFDVSSDVLQRDRIAKC